MTSSSTHSDLKMTPTTISRSGAASRNENGELCYTHCPNCGRVLVRSVREEIAGMGFCPSPTNACGDTNLYLLVEQPSARVNDTGPAPDVT